MTSVEWRRVGEFSEGGDLGVAPSAEETATRYESSTGERALVVPASAVEVIGRADDDLAVAFVDPATSVAARGLLRALGDESVVVALPSGAGADLTAAGGRVVNADDVLDLYRLSERGEFTPRSPAEPGRLGEGAGSLEGREDWFERRHGSAE